jgi:hypothetical protein
MTIKKPDPYVSPLQDAAARSAVLEIKLSDRAISTKHLASTHPDRRNQWQPPSKMKMNLQNIGWYVKAAPSILGRRGTVMRMRNTKPYGNRVSSGIIVHRATSIRVDVRVSMYHYQHSFRFNRGGATLVALLHDSNSSNSNQKGITTLTQLFSPLFMSLPRPRSSFILTSRASRLNGILTRHQLECRFPGKPQFYHSISQSTNHQHSQSSRPIQSYPRQRMINLLQPFHQFSVHLQKDRTYLSLEIEYGSSIRSSIRRLGLEWGRWRWCLLLDGSRREGCCIWWRSDYGTWGRRWEFLFVG